MSSPATQAEETSPAQNKTDVLSDKLEGTRLLLLNTVITLVIVMAAMVFYYRASNSNQDIGVLDVSEIYQFAQAKLATEYLKDENTDQRREQIKQEYQAFGKKLETTINQIMNECNCVLVTREVVLTTNATDYTSAAKQRMGL